MLLKDRARVLGETHAPSPGPATVTIEAWTRQAQASGMEEYQIETLIKMTRLRRAGPPPGGGWIGSNHYHPYSKIQVDLEKASDPQPGRTR